MKGLIIILILEREPTILLLSRVGDSEAGVLKRLGLEVKHIWSQVMAQVHTNWVTLNKSLSLSETQFYSSVKLE